MRGVEYHPTRDEHFPKLRRGHGTTHPQARTDKDGQLIRNACACVAEGCAVRGNVGQEHWNAEANVQDWMAERGL